MKGCIIQPLREYYIEDYTLKRERGDPLQVDLDKLGFVDALNFAYSPSYRDYTPLIIITVLPITYLSLYIIYNIVHVLGPYITDYSTF